METRPADWTWPGISVREGRIEGIENRENIVGEARVEQRENMARIERL